MLGDLAAGLDLADPDARPLPGEPDQPSQKPTICHMASSPRHPGISGIAGEVAAEKPQLGGGISSSATT